MKKASVQEITTQTEPQGMMNKTIQKENTIPLKDFLQSNAFKIHDNAVVINSFLDKIYNK